MTNTNRQAFLQARAVATQQQRALAGQKFRAAYRSAGFSRASAAKFLHVCERTLHNWESGSRPVPFAAMKLMRIWARYELPGHAWNGWCLHSGKLWSPEGHGFNPHDSSWWSLLCRRAAVGSEALAHNARLRKRLAEVQQDTQMRAQPLVRVHLRDLQPACNVPQLHRPGGAFSSPVSDLMPRTICFQAGVVAPPESLIYGTGTNSHGLHKSSTGAAFQPIGRA